MKSYELGRKAFRESLGNPLPDCPFPKSGSSGERTAWWDGWYDEKHLYTLGHIFDRYGIEWPVPRHEVNELRKVGRS